MLTIVPRVPVRTISRALACATRNTPDRLTSSTPFHASSPSSRLAPRATVPALLTTIAGAPRSALLLAIASATLAASVTSSAYARTSPGRSTAAPISAATVRPSSMRRPASATLAPCAASTFAK